MSDQQDVDITTWKNLARKRIESGQMSEEEWGRVLSALLRGSEDFGIELFDDAVERSRSSPSDDDEPITREWWSKLSPVDLVDFDGAVIQLVAYCAPLPHIRTRRQVRELCRALGIETREGKP